ncbi:MAG: nicotinamide-nucleotide amidohydrolase family protein [Treponema sp.]|jgi:PncC family amidohydrolase|nr:nicotinamide-nucleotide amidohydrolase family protein [Treponema sp.]
MSQDGNSAGSGDSAAGGEALVRQLTETLSRRSQTAAAAESCTAGLVADLFARLPGASRVFWGSLVTYTVDAKVKILGLDRRELERCGPVSRETACAMALGVLEKSGADFAVAVTGLAGPDGDGTAVPVGTVWIAVAGRDRIPQARMFSFKGLRNEIREKAALEALKFLSRHAGHTVLSPPKI